MRWSVLEKPEDKVKADEPGLFFGPVSCVTTLVMISSRLDTNLDRPSTKVVRNVKVVLWVCVVNRAGFC